MKSSVKSRKETTESSTRGRARNGMGKRRKGRTHNEAPQTGPSSDDGDDPAWYPGDIVDSKSVWGRQLSSKGMEGTKKDDEPSSPGARPARPAATAGNGRKKRRLSHGATAQQVTPSAHPPAGPPVLASEHQSVEESVGRPEVASIQGFSRGALPEKVYQDAGAEDDMIAVHPNLDSERETRRKEERVVLRGSYQSRSLRPTTPPSQENLDDDAVDVPAAGIAHVPGLRDTTAGSPLRSSPVTSATAGSIIPSPYTSRAVYTDSDVLGVTRVETWPVDTSPPRLTSASRSAGFLKCKGRVSERSREHVSCPKDNLLYDLLMEEEGDSRGRGSSSGPLIDAECPTNHSEEGRRLPVPLPNVGLFFHDSQGGGTLGGIGVEFAVVRLMVDFPSAKMAISDLMGLLQLNVVSFRVLDEMSHVSPYFLRVIPAPFESTAIATPFRRAGLQSGDLILDLNGIGIGADGRGRWWEDAEFLFHTPTEEGSIHDEARAELELGILQMTGETSLTVEDPDSKRAKRKWVFDRLVHDQCVISELQDLGPELTSSLRRTAEGLRRGAECSRRIAPGSEIAIASSSTRHRHHSGSEPSLLHQQQAAPLTATARVLKARVDNMLQMDTKGCFGSRRDRGAHEQRNMTASASEDSRDITRGAAGAACFSALSPDFPSSKRASESRSDTAGRGLERRGGWYEIFCARTS